MQSRHLPIILLAACLVLAVAIASVTGAWPAALATALAGAAMAIALKSRDEGGGDQDILSEELAALHDADEAAETELLRLRRLIDELAEVLEQVASESPQGAAPANLTRLEDELESLKSRTRRFGELGPISARLDKLENGLRSVEENREAPPADPEARAALQAFEKRMRSLEALGSRVETLDAWRSEADSALEEVAGLASRAVAQSSRPALSAPPPSPPMKRPAAPPPTPVRQNVKARMVKPRPEPSAPPRPPAEGGPVRLTPVFTPKLGAPKAFIADAPADATCSPASLFLRAETVIRQLAQAGREALVFVRAPSGALTDEDFLRIAFKATADRELAERIIMLVAQGDMNDRARAALTGLADKGMRFALDDVNDWSFNLATLAAGGLRYVLVDGPGMAHSALEQGGDAGQLSAALEGRGVGLVASRLEAVSELEAVAALRPALVTGGGLGPSRVVEARPS